MVKRKISPLLFVVPLVMCCSCSSQTAQPEVLEVAAGRLGRYVSLARSGGRLLAVFSDWKTTSLCIAEIPLGPHLPVESPKTQIIDKIDVTPPLSPVFGRHVLVIRGGEETVFYLDRRSEEKSVLKLASRSRDSDQWKLDVIEPSGSPISVLTDGEGGLALFWATESLVTLSLPGARAPLSLLSPFSPVGTASLLAEGGTAAGTESRARGFTVFDSVRRSLIAFRWDNGQLRQSIVPGCGPVHSSILTPEGLLAVLTWDPGKRRIFLLEEQAGSHVFLRTTVALSEGTNALSLVPSAGRSSLSRPDTMRRQSGFLFLFDEVKRRGGGKVSYRLCVLEPGVRYRKRVLLSGDTPIGGFATLPANDALYILALQGDLKLLRLSLSLAP
jgi:hypothetical protein